MSDRDGRNALGLDLDGGGLVLRGLGLWLDPTRAVPAAFVSHAHVGSAALESGRVFASPETLALTGRAGAPFEWDGAVDWPVEAAYGGGTARLTSAPAGHVLGAAQLVIEHAGRRLVYTGDWSDEADETHPAGAVVPCDELVVTTTFALPIFRFDAAARTLAALVDWCAAQLLDGMTPIVLARSPGPAQAIVRALSARGLPVSGDDEVRRACAAYEALGIVLGPVRPHEAKERGRAVVASAEARAKELRARGRVAVAYASGWALLDAAVEQKRADESFVLADQADHDRLVALVRATGAGRVVATRGDARPFVQLLRGMGVDAAALETAAIDERGAS